jgi:quercetin dioxygenase-like cupin family protein
VVDNTGAEDIVVVLVVTPAEEGASPEPGIVKLSDSDTLPAGNDREFRFVVQREPGSGNVTQFVGVIPPGRAPDHSHVYDEVVYVLEGEGSLHIGDESHPIGPGTCMYLPPQVVHALENGSDRPMRVLGVFHPSGDPASRAYEANE